VGNVVKKKSIFMPFTYAHSIEFMRVPKQHTKKRAGHTHTEEPTTCAYTRQFVFSHLLPSFLTVGK